MKFTVSSAALSKQLNAISGVIANNPIVPILENFLFEVSQGKLTVTASDLQTFATTTLTVEAQEEASIAIPARILLETLKNLPEQPVTFSVDDRTYSVEISVNNGRYRLAGENATDFPTIAPIQEGISVDIPSEVLKRAIGQALIAASNNELRPAINGVYVDFREQGVIFVSTDGHRLVRYTRSDIGVATQRPFIIPRKTLTLFNALLQSENRPVKIAFDDLYIYFQLPNFSMISRLIDERYPDYENVIPAHNPSKLTINRLDLINSLRRIAIYANKTTYQVKLGLSGSTLQVFSEDFEFSNEASEQLPCEYEGEPIEIGFNAKFLIEVLSNVPSDEVEMRFSDSTKPCLIFPKEKEEGEDMLLLIMPIIVKE